MKYSFRGGLTLGKNVPAAKPSFGTYVPNAVFFSLPEDGRICVNEGESVSIGTPLIERDSRPPVLSSVSGTASFADGKVIVISDGKSRIDSRYEPLKNENLSEMSDEEIRTKLMHFGIEIPKKSEKKPRTLLINAVENDTHGQSVYRLLCSGAGDVVGGIKILMKYYGVRTAVIAIPSAMKPAIAEVSAYCPHGMIRIAEVSRKYPEGDPHILVYAVFGIEIHPAKETADAGYPVVSPAVCAAVFRAFGYGVPRTSHLVTVCGDCTPRDFCLSVPFGSRIGDIMQDHCRNTPNKRILAVNGGEMSNRLLNDADTVDDTIDTIAFFSPRALPLPTLPYPCVDCGRCAAICPTRLSPAFLKRFIDAGNERGCRNFDIDGCIGCGCCTAICPSHINLCDAILDKKNEMASAAASKESAEQNSEETIARDTPPQSKDACFPNQVAGHHPILRAKDSLLGYSIDWLLALTPLYVWATYLFGARALVITLISILSSLAFDTLVNRITRKRWRPEPTSALTGALLSLGLPVTSPLWLPVLGALFACLIVRPINRRIDFISIDPAVTSLLSLSLLFPHIMFEYAPVDAVLSPFSITCTFTKAGESMLSVLTRGVLPKDDLGTLFIGIRSGVIGEVSAMLLIVAFIWLCLRRLIRPCLGVSCLTVTALLLYLYPKTPLASDLIALRFTGYELMTGGLLLGVLILSGSTDICPLSVKAALISGIIGGAVIAMTRLYLWQDYAVLIGLTVMSLIGRPLDLLLHYDVFGGKNKPKKQKTAAV